MKFEISRTNVDSNEQPCSGAEPFWVGPPPETEGMVNKLWSIEIATLDDLLAFAKEYGGRLVISYNSELPSLEIYDGYRE